MCVVSMIGEHYGDKWQKQYPYLYPETIPASDTKIILNPQTITREEFDALKKDVQEMKELLKRAKIYDEEHNEPDCQMEEKVALLRKIAELVGVDLENIL